MKLDDLIAKDTDPGIQLDAVVVSALNVFGFSHVTYSLYMRSTPPPPYVGIIVGIRKDGTSHTWTGTGTDAEEARINAIDSLAKWVLNKPIPYYPTGVTP